jgi:putative SOS response-associated peptidase YedK
MCSNYEAVTRADRLLSFFGVVREGDDKPVIAFPTNMAPFIRLAEDGSGHRRVSEGAFGLVPGFAKELVYGRNKYNARSETVHSKPSYRGAWRMGQRCVIPAEGFYEPYYETAESKPVRWRIQQPGEVPLGIAGIWEKWIDPDGREVFSFSMLTVNADGHPVMSKFHRPEDEKRMVVILDPEEYDEWLSCPVNKAPKFFRQWMGQLDTFPAPLPPRPTKEKPPSKRLTKREVPGDPPAQFDLF